MQKATTHLHNNTDKDKMKEIKTTPVPVVNPKKADKLRDADKKLLKKIIETTMPIVVGLLLSCLWLYDVNLGSTSGGISIFTVDHANTPPRHQDRDLGALRTPRQGCEKCKILPSSNSIENKEDNKRNDIAGKSIPDKLQGKYLEKEINKELELEKYGLAFCDKKYKLDVVSPVYDLVEILGEKWEKPINSELLSIEKIVKTPTEGSEIFNLNDSKTSRYRQLILITFDLKEFSESSSKDIYSLTPENKARIKLVLRGIDARSQAILFEKELTQEVCVMDWGRYQQIETSDLSDDNTTYAYSKAMRQVLEQTTDDIISLLHKYFP